MSGYNIKLFNNNYLISNLSQKHPLPKSDYFKQKKFNLVRLDAENDLFCTVI